MFTLPFERINSDIFSKYLYFCHLQVKTKVLTRVVEFSHVLSVSVNPLLVKKVVGEVSHRPVVCPQEFLFKSEIW